MTALSRYVFRQVSIVALFVTMTLAGAIWLTQSLRFVEMIVNRGLGIETYLYLTLLLLPSFLSVILPIALFTAITFTYNRLTTDSEIVVMRALGLGPAQLARPALRAALLAVGFGYVMNLYFLPLSSRQFKEMEFDLRNDYSALLLREGAFNMVSDGITVYIRAREANGELVGILVHDNRNRDRPTTLMAERGALVIAGDGPRVVMVNGNRQQVDRANGQLSLLNFDRYTVELSGLSQGRAFRWREPRERYLHELLWPEGSAEDVAYASRLRAEIHNRLIQPLYTLAFALVALALLLSGEFNRRGQAKRIVAAIVIVVALQAGLIALTSTLTRMPWLAPFAYALPVVTIAASAWWLMRSPARRARLVPAVI
jgi:lipopolysaccharide export system permease protein